MNRVLGLIKPQFEGMILPVPLQYVPALHRMHDVAPFVMHIR